MSEQDKFSPMDAIVKPGQCKCCGHSPSPPEAVGDAVEFGEWLRTFEVLTKEHGYWVLESQVSTEYLYKHFRSRKGALPVEPPPSSVVGEAEKEMAKAIMNICYSNDLMRCVWCEYDFRDGHNEQCIVRKAEKLLPPNTEGAG